MEDEGIVKKSKIFFTVFFVILIICLIIYFVFGKDKNLNPINPGNPDIPDNPDEVIINENGVYGLFVNLEDDSLTSISGILNSSIKLEPVASPIGKVKVLFLKIN